MILVYWSIIWYWLLAIFTFSDIVTTKILLAFGAHEGNPVMAALMDYLVEIKLGYLILMIGVILVVERHHRGNGWVPAALGACITFAAVISNILQFH